MSLTIASLFVKILVYPCFAVYLAAVVFLDERRLYRFLLFTFSFAVVFKASSTGRSFFTFVEILAAIKLIFLKRRFQIPFLAVTMLLAAEMLLSSLIDMDICKVMLELLLFYFFTVDYDENDANRYSTAFIMGLIISSVVGLFKEQLPRLLQMYDDLNYEWINGEYTIRFSGIYNDPNYFSIALALCVIVLLSLLMGRQVADKWYGMILFVVISAFGFATISKSFFLIYFSIILAYAIFAKSENSPLKRIAVVTVLIAVLLLNPFGLLDGIYARFESSELTTGRSRIWGYYLDTIGQSWSTVLLGYGIGAPYVIRKAAHNIYIETLYYIGALGAVLFLTALWVIVRGNARKMKRGFLNYIGFGAIAAQYFMLCGLKAFELPFYLMIAYMIYNNDYASGVALIGGGRKNAHI